MIVSTLVLVVAFWRIIYLVDTKKYEYQMEMEMCSDTTITRHSASDTRSADAGWRAPSPHSSLLLRALSAAGVT